MGREAALKRGGTNVSVQSTYIFRYVSDFDRKFRGYQNPPTFSDTLVTSIENSGDTRK
jgi:hypothetical protein